MLRLVAVLFFLLCLSGSSTATTEIIRDPNAWNYAPLQYDELVVRGTVSAVIETTVPVADFFLEEGEDRSQGLLTVLKVSVRVAETLRGAQAAPEWSFLYWNDDIGNAKSIFPVGKEMLIAASMHPRLGVYSRTGLYGQYLREGDHWSSCLTPRGQRSFEDRSLRDKVNEMEIQQVSENAELVFVGIITAIDEATVRGPSGAAAKQLTLSFSVEHVEKGTWNDARISVVMLTRGMYLPAWRKHVPADYAIGERWLCFVRKNEAGWYPFAGSNGLLRVEADGLVYDNRVPFWHSKAAVSDVVRSVSEER